MNPPSKYQSLFLTPRSPNGKRLQMRALRRHMHASEDKVPDPASKGMQGLGGQMAPYQPGGTGGSSGQTGGNTSKMWDVPHLDRRDYPQTIYPATSSFHPTLSPGVSHYDSSQDSEELDRALEKPRYGIEGAIDGSKSGADRTELNFDITKKLPAGAELPERDNDYFAENRHGPEERRKEDLQRAYDVRHTMHVEPSVFPGQQQPPPQPVHIPAPIPGTFTPKSHTKPVPDSELRPSREWLNKSGEAPDSLRYSPFVRNTR